MEPLGRFHRRLRWTQASLLVGQSKDNELDLEELRMQALLVSEIASSIEVSSLHQRIVHCLDSSKS
jgi:hypothetical protein